MTRIVTALAALALAGNHVAAQQCELPAGVSVASGNGGSIRTELGYGIVLNEGSTLSREAVVIHDSRLPLDFSGTPILRTTYADRNFRYATTAEVIASDDVTAFGATFMTFDVFGERENSLGATKVVDVPAGETFKEDWRWRLPSESEASEYFASIAFIRRVRTADGQVHYADTNTVLCVAELYSLSLTEAEIEDEGN